MILSIFIQPVPLKFFRIDKAENKLDELASRRNSFYG
jgi:hypothetical protein